MSMKAKPGWVKYSLRSNKERLAHVRIILREMQGCYSHHQDGSSLERPNDLFSLLFNDMRYCLDPKARAFERRVK